MLLDYFPQLNFLLDIKDHLTYYLSLTNFKDRNETYLLNSMVHHLLDFLYHFLIIIKYKAAFFVIKIIQKNPFC
jgi:hypothetical protein